MQTVTVATTAAALVLAAVLPSSVGRALILYFGHFLPAMRLVRAILHPGVHRSLRQIPRQSGRSDAFAAGGSGAGCGGLDTETRSASSAAAFAGDAVSAVSAAVIRHFVLLHGLHSAILAPLFRLGMVRRSLELPIVCWMASPDGSCRGSARLYYGLVVRLLRYQERMHEGPDMESRLDDALDRAGGYVRRGGVAVLMGGGGELLTSLWRLAVGSGEGSGGDKDQRSSKDDNGHGESNDDIGEDGGGRMDWQRDPQHSFQGSLCCVQELVSPEISGTEDEEEETTEVNDDVTDSDGDRQTEAGYTRDFLAMLQRGLYVFARVDFGIDAHNQHCAAEGGRELSLQILSYEPCLNALLLFPLDRRRRRPRSRSQGRLRKGNNLILPFSQIDGLHESTSGEQGISIRIRMRTTEVAPNGDSLGDIGKSHGGHTHPRVDGDDPVRGVRAAQIVLTDQADRDVLMEGLVRLWMGT